MNAAEAGSTAKEAFVPRTVLVAALTAAAITSLIPALPKTPVLPSAGYTEAATVRRAVRAHP